MTARTFMLIVGLILAIFTSIAVMLIPAKVVDNRKVIVWTTDPNPQRDPQVEWYNKKYPKNFLKIDPANSDVMKVVVQSSAGMGPDVIGHVHEGVFQTYLDAGILWDITEQAKEMGFGLDTLHPAIRPLVTQPVAGKDGTITQRQFVYPCNVYHTYILYNKNVFDKFNVPYPKEDLTWEEYIDISKKLTKFTSKDSQVPDIFGTSDSNLKIILWGKGGAMINKDGTRSLFDSEKAIDALMFKHDLLYKHGIEPSPTQKAAISGQGGWGGNISWFGEGKVGMFWGARWVLIQLRRFIAMQHTLKENWDKEHPGEKYQGAPVLRMGAVKVPRFKGKPRYTGFGSRGAGINKQSKNREEALTFLQYLASAEYSKTINDGADSKPGNLKYNKLELFEHPDFPGEKEIHEMSIKAIPDGRITPRSMFINAATLGRIYKDVQSNLISHEKITREEVKKMLQTASHEIDLEIARNIKRNPHLRKIYDKMLENGAEPIKMNLEEVD